MFSAITFETPLQMNVRPVTTSNELSRIFAAAVVSRQFCQMLLHDPHHALQTGYLGETFKLSDEERDLLMSIRAESLADLARQMQLALGNHSLNLRS